LFAVAVAVTGTVTVHVIAPAAAGAGASVPPVSVTELAPVVTRPPHVVEAGSPDARYAILERIDGDWDVTFRLDMMGAVNGCQTLEPALEASGSGSVILMSSTAAVETFIYPQAFNAVKAAILTYGKQLSQLWAPKNIRVNMISPGPVAYPGGNWAMIKDAVPDLYTKTLSEMPLGRFGAPEDVARSMVFLSSPMASYITGTNLVIDGGYTRRVQF